MISSCSGLRVLPETNADGLFQASIETVMIFCWSCAKTTLCYQMIGALLMSALRLYTYGECLLTHH